MTDAIYHSRRCIEYTMKQGRLTFHTNKGQNRCSHPECGGLLKVGDRVVRKQKGGRYSSGTRIYHKACAEVLNII